jgi:rsbT co-antagonist protein RsbR
MTTLIKDSLIQLIKANESQILNDWLQGQRSAATLRPDLLSEKELQQQSTEFLKLFINAISGQKANNFDSAEYIALFDFLRRISDSRAQQGFTPVQTAIFIFSLKQPIFGFLSQQSQQNIADILADFWPVTLLLDQLGLFTTEEHQKSRDRIIKQQQQELLELSTPVAKLWQGIIVLPLIGTLDSARTQQVMENLLQKIVETNSSVAIIDIGGIPMVDTMVAQHLIKTISAARLMGAECIVSGIRPQIAQTMVHLGISLQQVVTKATLADAVELAMQKAGYNVITV